jgi:hypothetical protein
MTTLPICFEVVMWIICFLVGVDFIISGYLVFKTDEKYIKKPKLFGLLAIAACQNLYELSKHKNRYLEIKYTYKYMRVYAIFSGILLLIMSITGFIGIRLLR